MIFEQFSKKKRKHETKDSKSKPLKKGITVYHIVKFVKSVMETLNENRICDYFIVMDNCRIHHSLFVVDAINKRGYKPLHFLIS